MIRRYFIPLLLAALLLPASAAASDVRIAANTSAQVRSYFNQSPRLPYLINIARQRGLCFGRAINFGQATIPAGVSPWPMVWLGVFDILGHSARANRALYQRSSDLLLSRERLLSNPLRGGLLGIRESLLIGRDIPSGDFYCQVLENWKRSGYYYPYYYIYQAVPQRTFSRNNQIFKQASRKIGLAGQFIEERWGKSWSERFSKFPQHRVLQAFFNRGLS